MMENDKTVIEMKNVCFFRPGREVLHDVAFRVAEHSLVAVVGPNGGGKTTLLKIIMGALAPSCGEVKVFGGKPADALPRIGYVPQQINIDPRFPLTVFEAVLMGRAGKIRFRYGKADREAARRAIAKVEMGDMLKASFAALSGGERQRVMIAQALASEPDLLLLDEPLANVDPAHTAQLYDLFRELAETITVLMVSHNLAVVSDKATHVLCVNGTVGMHRLGEVASETFRTSFGATLATLEHHNCSVAAGGGCKCARCGEVAQ
ncbi:MAG: ABC transporter ATP-binding protein [Kiritimatiellae bacterium]|nr:ABC transporter ATP-binding protein [Kiritimatiellia bacterium]